MKVIKLAHSLDTKHPVHKAMVFMAERLEEKSNGLMKIDIYPGSQLGSERELIELLQMGIIGITKVSSATLENFVPSARIFGMPYIFKDHEHYWRVLKSDIGEKILLDCEDYWLRGLGYYDAGSRSFYTKENPVLTPDDLTGLKIRVMKSQISVETIQTLGGSATPIVWGELYSALQQGVVDAAENNPPSLFFSRHYEICKYYSLDEHTSPPDMLIVSKYQWNSLNAEQQKILQEAVDESVEFQRQLWKETEEEVLSKLKESGVEVYHPDKEPFRKKVEPLYEKFKDTELYDLLMMIREIK
ncbi:MAG: TRAP transporter substrate-binding protein [Melioribacteraceae bacterium]|nr:TRAP transporter substrate-binding protein [Melioribacteraceae bacterium]